MDSFYNVNVKRNIPFIILNKLNETLESLREESYLFDLTKNDKKLCGDKFSISREITKENEKKKGKTSLFRIEPCYGSMYYTAERLAEIKENSDIVHTLFDFFNFKVYLELENFRENEIEDNWGINFDIVLKIEINESLLFSENIYDSFLEDKLIDLCNEYYNDTDNNVIIVDIFITKKTGEFFSKKCTLNIEDSEVYLEEEDLRDIDSAFVVSHKYRFDLDNIQLNGKVKLNRKAIQKWQLVYHDYLSISEKLDSNSFEIDYIEDQLYISGIKIDKSLIENYIILNIENEIGMINSLTFDRYEINNLNELTELRETLNDYGSRFILFNKVSKRYVNCDILDNTVLFDLLKKQKELLF